MRSQVKLIQLDGKLPNLALMKIAHWHRQQGDQVHLAQSPQHSLFEPRHYDAVYASAIFDHSAPAINQVIAARPDATVGGTGSPHNTYGTVEQALELDSYEHYDYSIYPNYPWSIGFTQRGCRLKCPFCVVPDKEGQPRPVNTIHDIWRPDAPRAIHLLDNDFFGQPTDQWKERIRELREGDFKVSFNQGINIRLITDEAAQALASVQYRDDQFRRRRLYTAWDNLGHEKIFFRGLEKLNQAGIPSKHVMVYMLIGFDPDETMAQVFHRYRRIKAAGCMPYPMVYDPSNRLLKAFQRWVIMRYDQFISWPKFRKRL